MNVSAQRIVQVGLLLSLASARNRLFAQQSGPPRNPFFAYCVGIGVEPSAATLPAQMQLAPMLKELGYDSMALAGLDAPSRCSRSWRSTGRS